MFLKNILNILCWEKEKKTSKARDYQLYNSICMKHKKKQTLSTVREPDLWLPGFKGSEN